MSNSAPEGTPAPANPRISVRIGSRTVEAAAGQSVAGVLMAHGIDAWRTTRRNGSPRGLFCGIGVCFDCLIAIDGTPNQRACLVEARDGMRIGEADTEPEAAHDPHAELDHAQRPDAEQTHAQRPEHDGPEESRS